MNIIFGIVLLGFLAFSLAWYISTKVIRQPREIHSDDWNRYQLQPERLTFTATDGLALAGAFIPGTNGATIILLHGYGRSKEQMLPQASFLNKAGYAIFMFDFRGSGESQGKYITFGAREQRDLAGAIAYLRTRKDVDLSQIGLLGFSMGGAVAIMKSGDIPEIKAIVIASSYARFKTIIWKNFQDYLKGIPFFPIGYFTIWMIKLRTGCYLPTIAPVKYIHTLRARPLMIIHSSYDKRIPVEEAFEFYKKAPWLKEFWLVQHAEHDEVYTITGDQYEEKLLNFYRQYLLGL
ncbi:MAG: alpha/beta hydrolase [Patescibacteria group bacterium]|nr:alpha/beta hydrolase [Patescibacteria group bacterium]